MTTTGLRDIRAGMFNVFVKLNAGDISIDHAFAASKVAREIIASYDSENERAEIMLKAIEAGVNSVEPLLIEESV